MRVPKTSEPRRQLTYPRRGGSGGVPSASPPRPARRPLPTAPGRLAHASPPGVSARAGGVWPGAVSGRTAGVSPAPRLPAPLGAPEAPTGSLGCSGVTRRCPPTLPGQFLPPPAPIVLTIVSFSLPPRRVLQPVCSPSFPLPPLHPRARL